MIIIYNFYFKKVKKSHKKSQENNLTMKILHYFNHFPIVNLNFSITLVTNRLNLLLFTIKSFLQHDDNCILLSILC
jgi:hypothetical protein